MSIACKIDETILLEQIKDGHQSSFRLLFDSYYKHLHAYAGKFVSEDAAHDIVQELFSTIWQKRDNLTIKSSLHNYLFTGIRNNCLQWLDKQKVRNRYQQDKCLELTIEEVNCFNSQTLQSLLEIELKAKIEDAINKLPSQCQRVFRMSRITQMRNKDIAEELDISPKTVEKHLTKALRLMREELKEYLPLMITFLS